MTKRATGSSPDIPGTVAVTRTGVSTRSPQSSALPDQAGDRFAVLAGEKGVPFRPFQEFGG
jgi:hypothetical protein